MTQPDPAEQFILIFAKLSITIGTLLVLVIRLSCRMSMTAISMDFLIF